MRDLSDDHRKTLENSFEMQRDLGIGPFFREGASDDLTPKCVPLACAFAEETETGNPNEGPMTETETRRFVRISCFIIRNTIS